MVGYRKKMRPVRRRPVGRRRARKVVQSTAVIRAPVSAPKRYKQKRTGGIGRTLGSLAGGYLAGPIGSKIGSYIGDRAANYFSKISGYGDYVVKSNSIVNGTEPPSFGTIGRATIVRHREYLGDVNGSIAFTPTTFSINPGLQNSFPWLSQLAANFEEYVIRGMVFEFKTTSATSLTSGTNTSMGAVIMATQYNALNAPFTSKTQMENYEFASSCVPSQSMLHPIECSRGETPLVALYTRNAVTQPSTGDARLYDLGVFTIATQGMQAANIIGELWVTFDVELLKPKLVDALNDDDLFDYWTCPVAGLSSNNVFCVADTSATNPSKLSPYSNLGSRIYVNNVLTLPGKSINQYYSVQYVAVGNATSLTNPIAITLGANVGYLDAYADSTFTSLAPPGGSSSSQQYQLFYIYVTAGVPGVSTGNTISFGATGTFPSGLSHVNIIINEIPRTFAL